VASREGEGPDAERGPGNYRSKRVKTPGISRSRMTSVTGVPCHTVSDSLWPRGTPEKSAAIFLLSFGAPVLQQLVTVRTTSQIRNRRRIWRFSSTIDISSSQIRKNWYANLRFFFWFSEDSSQIPNANFHNALKLDYDISYA
jgi:hypothetical protein